MLIYDKTVSVQHMKTTSTVNSKQSLSVNDVARIHSGQKDAAKRAADDWRLCRGVECDIL